MMTMQWRCLCHLDSHSLHCYTNGVSSFEVAARSISIESHPDADAIEIAKINGTEYVSIVRKDAEMKTGDVVIYIPEQAIVPESILREMGLWDDEKGKGGLAGSKGDRVKAIRLRGVLSQGLVYVPNDRLGELELGKNYAADLGIEKWIPVVPTSMSGKAAPYADMVTYTEIENIKNFPGVLIDGEEVIASEKVHGSCCVLRLDASGFHVSSKGMSGKSLELLEEVDESGQHKNAYWRVARQLDIPTKLEEMRDALGDPAAVSLYGEVYGDGIQDLHYGPKGGIDFIAFDVMVENGGVRRYLDFDESRQLVEGVGLRFVPELYRGPYTRDVIWATASGKEQISGREVHLREGVVVKPVHERIDPRMGRVVLKFVSDDYLLRKGAATEYE